MNYRLIVIPLVLMLTACGLGTNQDDAPVGFVYPDSGAAAALSESEFFSLAPEKQYSVANKLYGSVYKGVAAKEYFDFSFGVANPKVRSDSRPLLHFRQAINSPMEKDYNEELARIDQQYFIDVNSGNPRWEPAEVPLTYLFELDLSREHFNYWIAYQLVNNILFSPALELESVDVTDVQNVYSRLVFAISENVPLREIIYDHMVSEENWRRFRSPEDNTREMMEIFLLHFNDEDVPRAAKACQNWRLSDDDLGYKLLKSTDFNDEAQTLLGSNNIVSCEDFMRRIADHPSLIAAVTTRIVDQMLGNAPQEQRTALVQGIVNAKPTTFVEIYNVLINSRTYLLHAPKTKSVEETFFNLAGRLSWQPHAGFFDTLTMTYTGNNAATMRKMRQEAMTYKLGRPNEVATDTLSFAYYHNLVRDELLMREKILTRHNGFGWRSTFYEDEDVTALSNDGFIDYVFIALLMRKADAVEKAELLALFDELNLATNRQSQTRMLFDYISRLPELYSHSH